MFQLLYDLWASMTRTISLLLAIQKSQAQDVAIQNQMNLKLDQILKLITPGPAVRLIFTAYLDGETLYGVTKMNITDTQEVALSITPVDKKGNPAQLDGPPVWASSNTEVVTVTAAADGLSAVATAVGPLGTATISVKADGDLGAGVNTISGTLDITVVGSGAVTLKIVAGAVTEQTEVPPPPPQVP